MNLYKILSILLLILINYNYAQENFCSNQFTRQILIVISLDGFRNDYFNRGITPALNSFRLNGVYTSNLKTIFLPNALSTHHTIATGYYGSKHGVVGHVTFSGRDKLNWFAYGEKLYDYNRSIIPIWLLNENNGGTSASMMWPGAEFPAGYGQKKITYHVKYNPEIKMKGVFRQIVNWLNRTRNQPNLIMAYLPEPDKTGHYTGPNDHIHLSETLQELDNLRQYLRTKILQLRISHRVNVIYLSDHGMWPITTKNFKNLSTLPNCNDYYKFIGRHTYLEMGRLYRYHFNLKCEENIKKEYGDEVFLTRDEIALRKEMNLDRLSNALLLSKKGDAWGDNMWNKIKQYKNLYGRQITENTEYGVHGYEDDNDAIFMAKGPVFIYYKTFKTFDMVDLYSLFARVLSIEGNFSNDGNFSHVSGLLRKKSPRMDWTKPLVIIFICSIVHCAIFYFIVNAYIYHKFDDDEDAKLVKENPELQRLMKNR